MKLKKSAHTLSKALLFIIFRRMNTTKNVFEVIKSVRPPRLYIVSDGPRKDILGEAEQVSSVRDYILNSIDWDCSIYTLFRDYNLGSGMNIKNALDWFFANENSGIILEDDTLPAESFFDYCEELLHKYRDDSRIGAINGSNHIMQGAFTDSYSFSKYYGSWGWATWSRSWRNMDFEMSWLNSKDRENVIRRMGYSKDAYRYWEKMIRKVQTKQVDTWDYQWALSLAAQNQLCIVPKYNLVANIGFGEDATHTHEKPKEEYIVKHEIELPLKHPTRVLENICYDMLYERTNMITPFYKKVYFAVRNRVSKRIKTKRSLSNSLRKNQLKGVKY